MLTLIVSRVCSASSHRIVMVEEEWKSGRLKRRKEGRDDFSWKKMVV